MWLNCIMIVKLRISKQVLWIVVMSFSWLWYCTLTRKLLALGALSEGFIGSSYTIFSTSCESIMISKWRFKKSKWLYVWGVISGLFCPIALYLFFFFSSLFKASSVAYESSQARRWIGAAAAGLLHSHGIARSKPHLRPMQFAAMPDP